MSRRVFARMVAGRGLARSATAAATVLMAAVAALPAGAAADTPPYSLPVTLPQAKQSPAVDANAPYTPVVRTRGPYTLNIRIEATGKP